MELWRTWSHWLNDPVVANMLRALFGLAVIFAISRLILRSVTMYVADSDARYTARKAVSFLSWLLAAALLLATFSDRLTGLTVAFGVAGAGIAFALQEVIASFAGWVAVSFGNFYRAGDRVQVGGIRGDVIDVSLLRTTLMEVGDWVKGDLYNGRIVRVANSFVFKEPVFNYSADFPFLWDEIVFPVRYGSDWRHASDLLQGVVEQTVGEYARQSREAWINVARKYRIEEARIDPMITIRCDENWIEYTLRYVVDYRQRRSTKDKLFRRILEAVDASGGRVQIATAGFELLSAPGIDVRVKPAEAPSP
ncbi:MAG: mechanosensitive ion channel [Bryobacteraceae bacterium]